MDLADKLRELAGRIPNQRAVIKTEEATKHALVMPFISALGYNVFDPHEVTPELDADVGVKKGEKVDYAILRDGKPIMLFECKAVNANLDDVHASQLFRYFSVTDARIGILTNGVLYRFFADLDAPNKMDAKPFLELNMEALDDTSLTEVKRFAKGMFEIENVLSSANDLKYTREIKRLLALEMSQPSEEFVRYFASRVYPKNVTQAVREQFERILKQALQQFISERISDRLQQALKQEQTAVAAVSEPETAPPR